MARVYRADRGKPGTPGIYFGDGDPATLAPNAAAGSLYGRMDTGASYVKGGPGTSGAWALHAGGGGSGEANTGANVGASGAGVFRDKTGVTLNFRKLVAGAGISITQNADTIDIVRSALVDADIPAAIARDTEVTAAVAAHEAASDPHPQYALDSDLAAHVASSDPHTQYQKEAEKGSPNGYAALDGGGQVPLAQLPGGLGPTAVCWKSADQTIGAAAANLTGLTVALASGVGYRYRAFLIFTNGTTTAVHAARVVYSGTLGAGASGQSCWEARGQNGSPAAFLATTNFRRLVGLVNAAMAATTNGFGNHGNTTAFGVVEITGTIYTNAAGNLDIAMISSAAGGLVVRAGSFLEVWKI